MILTTTQFSGGGRTRRGSGGAADRRRHRVLGLQWRQLGFRGIKAARVRGGSKGVRGILYRGGRGCLGVRAKKERAARRRAAAGLGFGTSPARTRDRGRPRQAGPACRWLREKAGTGWAGGKEKVTGRRWGSLGRGRRKKRKGEGGGLGRLG